MTLGLSQTVILVAFMFSFVLAMTAAFFAAPAIAADIESGVAQAMLARPIRRSDLLLGKWLGLVLVIGAYALGSGLLELAVIGIVTGYAAPDPIRAVGYLAAEAVVLLTLALVLGVRLPGIASGAVVVVVYGLTWVAGVMGAVGAFFDTPALVRAADASRVLDSCRRTLARRGVQPGATGDHRGRRACVAPGRQSLLRVGTAVGGVPCVDRGVARARARRRDRPLPTTRDLTGRQTDGVDHRMTDEAQTPDGRRRTP